MVFQFEHINLDKHPGKRKWDLKPLDPQDLHEVFSKWQIQLDQKGWNSLFWNNHDLPRIISRWEMIQRNIVNEVGRCWLFISIS